MLVHDWLEPLRVLCLRTFDFKLIDLMILVDTLSLIGEQTSYMSICVGEGPEEEELQHLTVEQLRIKVRA